MRVLVLESDPAIRRSVASTLVAEGYQVEAKPLGRQGLNMVGSRDLDAMVIGIDGGAEDIAVWVRSVRQRSPGLPVVIMAEVAHLDGAVEALKLGADDYVLRPPSRVELRARLGRILERHDLDSRLAFFRDELTKKSELSRDEIQSPAMRNVVDRINRVAPMRSTVLVIGESGVGKELVARSIHLNSPRRAEPFVALNCAAMPSSLIESELFGHERGAFTGAHARTRGKFEIANRGTMFLDEIGEMDPGTQAKLLRVLEEREFMRIGGGDSIRVDVRVIAATNADLEELVARNRFRRDLYYRLKVVTIAVPPLRDRREDIPGLVETFLGQLSRANAVPRKTILPAAMARLQEYQWPGNVRELKNVLESILVSSPGDSIDIDALPTSMHGGPATDGDPVLNPGTTLEEMERELIRRTLEFTGGNRTHSADLLGIGVRTLQRKIRTYDIHIAPRRRRPRGVRTQRE